MLEIPCWATHSKPTEAGVSFVMCWTPSRFLVFEVSCGGSGPDRIADELIVVPRYLGEVKRHEVVGFVRLWFGVINERFIIISRRSCNDASVVAGFAGFVAELGDVFGTLARRFQFVGGRQWCRRELG